MEVGGIRRLYHVGRFLKILLCMQYTIYVFYLLYGDDLRHVRHSHTHKKKLFRRTLYQFGYLINKLRKLKHD